MVDGAGTAEPPLLVFADDWGRHPSSCQHLVRRLLCDHCVLWVNSIGTRRVRADAFTLRRGLEKLQSWGRGLQHVEPHLWVVDLPMLPQVGGRITRSLNERIASSRLRRCVAALRLHRPVVLTTLPYTGWLLRGLPRSGLVYYCTDDFSHWPFADREALEAAEREMVREADLILAVSRPLLERHEPTGRCHYLPHGVDFDHFASTCGLEPPAAVARLPRPRIGYFGLIYEKLDFTLLCQIAARFAHGSLIMIGPVTHCPAGFESLPNVHILGQKPYTDLPRWLAGLDVLLLPYLGEDEMIRQSGPLKLRECLATGKPTVGVDIPAIRALEPFVRVGKNSEHFVEQVGEAISESTDAALAARRRESVRHDGWDSRAAELRVRLGQLRAARRAARSTGQLTSV